MEIKIITHCHSTYSYDAKLSLRELKHLCIRNGVRAVCMTEHTDEMTRENAEKFVAECAALSDKSFRFIPGFEVPYKSAHILMIGQRNFYSSYTDKLDTLSEWTDEAPFVVLAHPVRNKFVVEDGLLNQIDALEVWNQQYEGKIVPRTRSLELFRALKILKPELVATGGVDLHRREHMGTPQLTLDVLELTEEAIIEKLKLGAFTVSSSKAFFYGTLPDVEAVIPKYRVRSFLSVSIIVVGKSVNKVLAGLGLKLPSKLKQLIRKRI